LTRAGSGSDILYRYSSTTHEYTYLGQYLTGISSNPYINGIDSRLSRIHVSWCYRNFVLFPESAVKDAHKQQAGPNGPENNCDLNYAYSDDEGETWNSSDGEVMAKLGSAVENGIASTIRTGARGARIFEIPMGSGILNQEAQCADWIGGFWVLNREKSNGKETWMVYHRDPKGLETTCQIPIRADLLGTWLKRPIMSTSPPTEIGARGSICVDRKNNVYLVLPGNSDSSLEILQARSEDKHEKFETVWRCENGYDGEPLVDVQRLETSDTLSLFTRTDKNGGGIRSVAVVDFYL
jgi:hypothetical protein